MAHGVDHKMENLACAAVICSVSELNPEKPRENEFGRFRDANLHLLSGENKARISIPASRPAFLLANVHPSVASSTMNYCFNRSGKVRHLKVSATRRRRMRFKVHRRITFESRFTPAAPDSDA